MSPAFKLPFIIRSFQPYTAHTINMIQRILHDIRQWWHTNALHSASNQVIPCRFCQPWSRENIKHTYATYLTWNSVYFPCRRDTTWLIPAPWSKCLNWLMASITSSFMPRSPVWLLLLVKLPELYAEFEKVSMEVLCPCPRYINVGQLGWVQTL